MSEVMDDFGNKNLFKEEVFKVPSRNVARRGRSRFPSRVNPEFSETKLNSDDAENITEFSDNRVPDTNVENIAQSSQPEITSNVVDHGSLSPNNRMSLKGTSSVLLSRHQGRVRHGGVSKSSSLRKCQKLDKIKKSLISSRQHHPNCPSLPQQNVNEQLLTLLSEASKVDDDAPFAFEDVIPATPERIHSTITNSINNRKTTFANIIKKQKTLRSLDQTGNTLNETEIKDENRSDQSIPLRKLQSSPVLSATDKMQANDIPRNATSSPKLNLNNASSQQENSANVQCLKKSSPSKKPRELLESSIPIKLSAVLNRIKQLNSQIDCNQHSDNNSSQQNAEKRRQNENVDRTPNRKVSKERHPSNCGEKGENVAQMQEPSDNCSERVVDSIKVKKAKPKKVFNSKDQTEKSSSNEKVDNDEGFVNKDQIEEVHAQEMQEEIQPIGIKESSDTEVANTQNDADKEAESQVNSLDKEKEQNCNADITKKCKTTKQSKEKGKNTEDKNREKSRKPKVINKNENTAESVVKKSPPVKRQRRKVTKKAVSDEEWDPESLRKRKRTPRKTKATKGKKNTEVDYETNESVSGATSRTSIMSSKIPTSTPSAMSVNKAAQKTDKTQNNDKNMEKDPENIQKMDASGESDNDDNVIKRPKHIVPKNSETSLQKLATSGTKNQNQIISEIVSNLEKTTERNMKSLQVSIARSPVIENMAINQSEDEQEQYVEIDLDEELLLRRKKTRRPPTPGKMRPNSATSGSESDGSKRNKKTDKTKTMSTEAAQLYRSIQNETMNANRSTTRKGKVGGKRNKKDSVANDQLKHVQFPKVLQPSTNVNFSYRRCAEENMSDKEKRLADLFEVINSNGNNDFATLDVGSYGAGKNKKSNKRTAKKKPEPKLSVEAKRNVSKKMKEMTNKALVDEKIRSLLASRPSDEGPNMFLVEHYKEDSPKVSEMNIEMVPPNDQNIHEENLNDIEPNIVIEAASDKESEDDIVCDINVSQESISTNQIEGNQEECNTSQNCEKNLSKLKLKSVGSAKSVKSSGSQSQSEIEPNDNTDTTLPSLIIETIRKESSKDNSLRGMDLAKMKDLIMDVTNTPNQTFVGEDRGETNANRVDSIYFRSNNIITIEDNATEDGENYQDCLTDNHDITLYCQSNVVKSNSPSSIAVSNLETGDSCDMMNFQQDLENAVKEKQQAIINTLMELEDHQHSVVGERSKTINSQIQYNFSSPKGEAILVLRRIDEVRKHNDHPSQDESSESDSERSVCSIILSARKSRRSQSFNELTSSDISDIFVNKKRQSTHVPHNEKSKIPTPKRKSITNNNKSVGSNLLARISEESIHRSIGSTPKSITSLDCSKYLGQGISPLRFSPRKALQIRKTQAIEAGDGVTTAARRISPRKAVSQLTRWKRGQNTASNTGGRPAKVQVRNVSCTSATSRMSMESSTEMEHSKTQTQKSNVIRNGSFYVPKSDAERRYREMGCNMRTTMDNWIITLTTMEQKMISFKREINLLKEELPSDCCIKHRKKNT